MCLFFFLPNATLNLFGQSEMVSRQKKKRKKRFLAHGPPGNLFPFICFYFCPRVICPPLFYFASGDPYHCLNLFNKDAEFFLFFWFLIFLIDSLVPYFAPPTDGLKHRLSLREKDVALEMPWFCLFFFFFSCIFLSFLLYSYQHG